jgi:hypothetical protein
MTSASLGLDFQKTKKLSPKAELCGKGGISRNKFHLLAEP